MLNLHSEKLQFFRCQKPRNPLLMDLEKTLHKINNQKNSI